MADTNLPENVEQDGGLSAVTQTSKSGLPGGLRTVAADPSQTQSILQQMQQLIAQRESPMSTFISGIKDATAWGAGGAEGPTQALALRGKQKAEEEKQLFDMRTQVAALKAAERQNQVMQNVMFGNQPTPGAQPQQQGAAPAGGSQFAMQQEANQQSGGLLNLVEDDGLRRQIAAQFFMPDGAPKAMTQLNAYLAKRAEEPAMAKEVRYMIQNGLINPNMIAPAVLTKFVGSGALVPSDVRGPGGTMQTSPLQSAAAISPTGVPRVAGTRPTAAPATVPGATVSTPAVAPSAPATVAPAAPAAPVAPVTRPQAAPAQTGAGGFAPGSKEELEIRQRGIGTELEETAKDIAKDRAATVEAGSNAGDRLASVQYINNLVATNPRAFGVLQKPGVLTAVLGAAEAGANIGNLGAVGIADISSAVRKAMPGATQEDIDAAQKATREFALMQLNAAKIYLKGQGAVSDAERNLIRELAGSVKNSPGAIRDFLKWNEIRADFDKKNGIAYKEFNKKNPNVSFEKYKETAEYERLKSEYENNINQFVKSSTAPKPNLNAHPALKLIDRYTQPKPR